ncbi:hypothetical protein [Moorena sp. SIO4G3]|uniref:tetratricopeptide repeat protein n=1 Tax=Moorena sp. SIO4G3 TaxID=2607821 RepID=UPI00142AF6E5|nr:hypothetical protein [Moorena sp. SIO4G3]NEO76226.1 hypothetical protein [Moorena sp. SIO4G3]
MSKKDLHEIIFANQNNPPSERISNLLDDVDNGRAKLVTTSYNYNNSLRHYKQKYRKKISSKKKEYFDKIIILPSLYLRLTIIVILFIMWFYIVEPFFLLNPFLWSAQNKCNQVLTNERKQSFNIRESCDSIINGFTKNKSALYLAHKNFGRANLVYWNDLDASEKAERKDKEIKKVQNHFKSAEEYNPKDPQVKFYIALMEDFKYFDFVREDNNQKCLLWPASKRYEKAINLYKDVAKVETVDNNFFALLELGHLLVSRDAGKISKNLKHTYWDDLNGYQKAIELYNKLQVADPNVKHTVLLSKAKAQLLNAEYQLINYYGEKAQNNREKAQDYFEKAQDYFKKAQKYLTDILKVKPKAYQIRYYLGNSYILANNQYKEAIIEYEEITEPDDTKFFYYALRDAGFVYYLNKKYNKAKDRLDRARELEVSETPIEKERRELMENYLEKIEKNKCDQLDTDNNICDIEDRSSLKQKLIKAGFFQAKLEFHDKKRRTDPFINVANDKLHECEKNPEF